VHNRQTQIIQQGTVLIIFSLDLKIDIIAKILYVGGEGCWARDTGKTDRQMDR